VHNAHVCMCIYLYDKGHNDDAGGTLAVCATRSVIDGVARAFLI